MIQNKNQLECKKIVCSNCNSNNVIKWCKRKTENRGIIQRYKCKDCGKFFTINDGFFRMRNAPQKITLCLDLFYRGVSTRKVQEHLQAFYPHNSSHKSIYKWIVKYAKIIGKFTDKLKVSSSGFVEFDEMEYHRRKQRNRNFSSRSIKKISKKVSEAIEVLVKEGRDKAMSVFNAN